MNKKKIWIIIGALLVIIAILCIVKITANKLNDSGEKVIINKITEFKIEDRTSLVRNGVIYVGENTKELENGYYDLKVINKESEINIVLNKLWYKEFNNDYIEDNYLAKICRKIVSKLNVKLNCEGLEYALYKYIKEGYTKVREGRAIEKLDTDIYCFELLNEEGMANLVIKGV